MDDNAHDSHDPLAPPDLSFGTTLRHLLVLWREEWRLGAVGLACAFLFTAVALAIPIVIQRAIDNAIVPGKPPGCGSTWPRSWCWR